MCIFKKVFGKLPAESCIAVGNKFCVYMQIYLWLCMLGACGWKRIS